MQTIGTHIKWNRIDLELENRIQMKLWGYGKIYGYWLVKLITVKMSYQIMKTYTINTHVKQNGTDYGIWMKY